MQLGILFISLIGPFLYHYGYKVSAAGILESIHSDVHKILGKSGDSRPVNEKYKPAFLANLSHTLSNLKSNQIVKFDSVITNIGKRYSPQTGQFTSPEDGIYMFSWTCLTPPGSRFETRLAINDNYISGNRANAQNINQYVQATKNVVVQMKKGDVATVRVLSYTGLSLYGDGNYFSSFSGFMI
ncbi:complement C1q-like protein 3 [Mytilus californianus]|uniref:complement C1q-like protein 3 n=1 Tax=Mytilus californianus TaxID=6549 RepID=UPI002246A25C|nr:complement C1q-like protein 3 [Mytilus californianus]